MLIVLGQMCKPPGDTHGSGAVVTARPVNSAWSGGCTPGAGVRVGVRARVSKRLS